MNASELRQKVEFKHIATPKYSVNHYGKMQTHQLENLKRDLELKQAKVQSTAMRNKTVQYRDKINYQNELDRIRNDLRKNEATVAEQAQTIQNILSERDILNGLIQKLTKEKNELEANQENLSQELNFSKDKLSAAEESKEILKSQFSLVTDELEDAKKKQTIDMITIKELTEKLAQSEVEKKQLNELNIRL